MSDWLAADLLAGRRLWTAAHRRTRRLRSLVRESSQAQPAQSGRATSHPPGCHAGSAIGHDRARLRRCGVDAARRVAPQRAEGSCCCSATKGSLGCGELPSAALEPSAPDCTHEFNLGPRVLARVVTRAPFARPIALVVLGLAWPVALSAPSTAGEARRRGGHRGGSGDLDRQRDSKGGGRGEAGFASCAAGPTSSLHALPTGTRERPARRASGDPAGPARRGAHGDSPGLDGARDVRK